MGNIYLSRENLHLKQQSWLRHPSFDNAVEYKQSILEFSRDLCRAEMIPFAQNPYDIACYDNVPSGDMITMRAINRRNIHQHRTLSFHFNAHELWFAWGYYESHVWDFDLWQWIRTRI